MLARDYIHGRTAVNIAASVEVAVTSGAAGSGDPLPPVRSVAERLGVSPATAAAAYRLLRDRGIVVSDGRRGTRIRPAPPLSTPLEDALPEGVRDLATGNPDVALLPTLRRFVRAEQRVYGGDLNDARLVAAARRQLGADGVPAAHITITSGALDGIERVLREYLRPGDRVIVEDPCFTGVADLLGALALTPIPVPVDDEGPLPEPLRRALKRKPAAAIVTPRAQNPTGASISLKRRRELRAILKLAPELLLIEDDHAGPVAGTGYETLVDAARARWAVVRSVSKSLGPDLRLSFVAADAATISRVEGRQALGIRWVSHILQRLVAALLEDRSTSRLLERAAETYTGRREALIGALHARGIEAHGASGLNVWIPVADEASVVRGLLSRGWAVNAGARYRIESSPAIRVTTASLDPRDAARLASDLAALRHGGAGVPTRAFRT